MTPPAIRVLLVEDNPWDAHLVSAMLTRADVGRPDRETYALIAADRLSSALERLRECPVDVVLLDLMLPDSDGIATLERLRACAGDVAIVVQTALDDEETGFRAMQAGAQDYLVKGRVDLEQLRRTMRYAIERHRLQAMVQQLTLTDDLTGLLNRRGFYAHARQQMKLIRRSAQRCVLVVADLDRFKELNDGYGHARGDEALVAVAEILRGTFRESDLIARVGGDEFVVLAVGTGSEDGESLVARLDERLESCDARGIFPMALPMSVGTVRIEPDDPSPIEEHVRRADALMYEHKRRRHEAGATLIAR